MTNFTLTIEERLFEFSRRQWRVRLFVILQGRQRGNGAVLRFLLDEISKLLHKITRHVHRRKEFD